MEQQNLSKILCSLIQFGIKKGKKQKLTIFILKSLATVKKYAKTHPFLVLYYFIEKIKPFCKIRILQISKRFYKLPVTISKIKQFALSIFWLLECCFKRKENTFHKRLVAEMIETLQSNSSQTIKLSRELHQISQTNKLYIKFRS